MNATAKVAPWPPLAMASNDAQPKAARLPFFAANGCIVTERIDRERFAVNCPECNTVVDIGPPFVADWAVDVPPTWLHTDDERRAVRLASIAAVKELAKAGYRL